MGLYKGGKRVSRFGGFTPMYRFRQYGPSRHMGRVRFTGPEVTRNVHTIARRRIQRSLLSARVVNNFRLRLLRRRTAAMVADYASPNTRRRLKSMLSPGTGRYFK